MGLIGAWLGSLYFGVPLILMSPTSFLARPVRWLRAIHDHRGTVSAAPNFGYELCLQRIDDGELGGLDLGSWRIAFNGAEPVSPGTLRRFAQRFGPHGVHPGTMKPVEYDQYVADLVNYLSYMAEPAQTHRKLWGIVVLFFLAGFFGITLALKREYWKDVR